jgi:hypothetical protein
VREVARAAGRLARLVSYVVGVTAYVDASLGVPLPAVAVAAGAVAIIVLIFIFVVAHLR